MQNKTIEAANPSQFEVTAREHERLLVSLVLVATALVYAPAVRFAFVLDDSWQIVQNQWVQSWRFVPGYFRGHVWPQLGSNPPLNYYRPLNFVWLQLNHTLFGLHPAGWHAFAILLHLLVTFLAYRVVRRVSGRVLVASVAALTFGIHPMRHETVGWISGTTESLWSAFFLVAFLAYLESREEHRWRWMGASGFFYAAALLSKEPAIVLPAIVCTHAWLYDRSSNNDAPLQPWTRRAWEAIQTGLPYLPVALAYLVLRWSVLRALSHPKVSVSLSSLLLSLPSVAFFYVRQWLVPNRASEYYAVLLQNQLSLPNVLLPLLALAAIVTLLWVLREKIGTHELIFASVWITALLLPAFDFGIFPPGAIVHDRYFYLASLGACFLLGLGMERLATGPQVWGFSKQWLAAVLALACLLSFETAKAVSYWTSDYAMLSHAILYSPNDPDARNRLSIEMALLGRGAYLRGDWPSAETYLENAKSLNPVAADNYLQLGMVDLNTNRSHQAEENFRGAIALRPDEPMFHFALGVALTQQNNCSEAMGQFTQSLALKPGFPGAQEQLEKCESAIQRNQALTSQNVAQR